MRSHVNVNFTTLSSLYKIVGVHELWYWTSWRRGLFAEYIDSLFRIKEQASGYPESCTTAEAKQEYIQNIFEHEGVLLNDAEMEKNPGLRQLATLCLNSHCEACIFYITALILIFGTQPVLLFSNCYFIF